jgi:hypothetical protein
MASVEEPKPELSAKIIGPSNVSELDEARVLLTGDERLRVEFSIQDLIKRLQPGSSVAHCGGCNGCMGCSM